MLLGKRPRPPMRRTTSMTEFSGDLRIVESTSPSTDIQDGSNNHNPPRHRPMEGVVTVIGSSDTNNNSNNNSGRRSQESHYQGPSDDGLDTRYLAAMVSPRNPRRSSGDFAVETAHFLKACGLCNRRLVPGKDIYIYRGEMAFCSLECRQQQMTLDDRKEKSCSMTSIKTEVPPQTTAGSDSSGNTGGETIAAA